MSKTRAERLEAFERWAARVKPEELREADPAIAKKVLEALEDYADTDECADTDETMAAARGGQAP